MKKSDVIKYFGSPGKVADALGIEPASVSQWGEDIPMRRAFEIERITNGALTVDYEPPKTESA